MTTRPLDYIYIAATVGLTVYGQIILKWRIRDVGPMPEGVGAKALFLVALVFDPFIFSGLLAAFVASLTWMAALTRFDLTHAYPIMSLSFVLVLLLGAWLLQEPVSLQRFIGVGLIVAGTVVASRG